MDNTYPPAPPSGGGGGGGGGGSAAARLALMQAGGGCCGVAAADAVGSGPLGQRSAQGTKLYRDKGYDVHTGGSPPLYVGESTPYSYNSKYCTAGTCSVDHHPSLAGMYLLLNFAD